LARSLARRSCWSSKDSDANHASASPVFAKQASRLFIWFS
jgi:hypothetical protein